MLPMYLKHRSKLSTLILIVAFVALSSFLILQQKPTLYIIGDSTVKNGAGTGGGGLWGWGDFIAPYFDTTRISIENAAAAEPVAGLSRLRVCGRRCLQN